MSKTFSFYTLGCKLNFSESAAIGRQLVQEGYQKVEFQEAADIYVINTCSVTDHADKKCKRIVKEALRHNPEAFVAIIGCYAQLKPKEIASIPGVDLVLGANEKFQLESFIGSAKKNLQAVIQEGDIREVDAYHASYSLGDRTRTFLKIQDGCDYFCSFCTIPLARGKSRSDSIMNVLKQAKEIVQNDVKEIVLTGVNTGDFGAQTGESFIDLLRGLSEIEGLQRLRISSIEPNLISDEIIELAAESKVIMPHFHIPLQSGSDRILKLMRRRYDTALYAAKIKKIKSLIPHCCIGVDVIVGFPGETNQDFMETVEFLKSLDISYLHVFTYSERINTTANKLPGKVAHGIRAERSKILHSLSEKKRRHFYSEILGQTRQVLWEAESDGKTMFGFTDNYVKMKCSYDPALVNEITTVELEKIDTDMVVTAKSLVFTF